MKMKRFRAPDLPSALNQIRSEIGSDAVILETRPVAPQGWRKWLDLFGKKLGMHGFPKEVEVMVAWEFPDTRKPAALQQAVQAIQTARKELAQAQSRPPTVVAQEFARKQEIPDVQQKVDHDSEAEDLEDDPSGTWSEEFRQIRRLLAQTLNRLDESEKQAVEQVLYPDWLEPIYWNLKRQGVSETMIRSILDPLIDQGPLTQRELEKTIIDSLARMIGPCQPIRLRKPGKCILLVGPTGAGKTTTVAKLAAYFLLEKGKKVGLVTCDTYRMGADEQLRRYGELLGLPLHVAHDLQELVRVCQQLAQLDIILVDTAGRSHRDELRMEELKAMVEQLPSAEVHLVIPTSFGSEHAAGLIERYRELNINRLIFSKLDEAEALGALINLPVMSGVPVSYISTGQRVPEDLKQASSKTLARLVFGKEVI